MKKILCGVLATVLALTLAVITGCGDGKEHTIRGTVTAIAADKSRVTLDHETIPGVMQAMEMDFPVSDANLLEGISVGDEVTGHVQELDELTVTRLQKQ